MRATSLRTLILVVLCAGAMSLLTVSGVAAQGKDTTDAPSDIQGASLQKSIQKYPQLDSTLGGLVADHEGGKVAARAAASQAPVHSGASVAVTIYINANLSAIRGFLESNGGDPRNVGKDYIEAYVPVSLLGQLSEQTGVTRIETIVPPVSSQDRSEPCTEDLGVVSGVVTTTGSWDLTCTVRYYSFGLSQSASVTISLTTSEDRDTLLILRKGGRTGARIASNNDIDYPTNKNSRLQYGLEPGTYTVDALIHAGAAIADFTLTIEAPVFDPIISQGAETHGALAWHRVGITGQGISVGILDVGFDEFERLFATELPSTIQGRCYTDSGLGSFVQHIYACSRLSDHGTAVAEAIVDIAPDVDLHISNPLSQSDVGDVIRAWAVPDGVDVIANSQGWLWDGPGDGTSESLRSPLKRVDDAVANGIVWVNSAGDAAGRTWFGAYADADSDGFIEFGAVLGVDDETNGVLLTEKVTVEVQLRWDDPWPGADSDLDLYLFYDANDNGLLEVNEVVARSDDFQWGRTSQYPYERITYTPTTTGEYDLVVSHVGGDAPNWIQLQVFDGVSGNIAHHTSRGSIGNPAESASPGMLVVGAASWSSTAVIEPFSGRGPTPDGRIKPDLVASDRADSATRGLSGFAGTGQAAAHVAGMAALVLQAFPAATPAQVAQYLRDHAQPRGAPVPNSTWGHGFVQLPPPPTTLATTLTAESTTTNPLMAQTTATTTVATTASTQTLSFGSADRLRLTPTTAADAELTITQPMVEKLEITTDVATTVTRLDGQTDTETGTLTLGPSDRLTITLSAGSSELTFTGGVSDVSRPFTLTIASAPGTPVVSSANQGRDTVPVDTLTVTWLPPLSDGGRAITSYDLRHRLAGSSTWPETPTATADTLTHAYTSLPDKGRLFDVQVRAVNAIDPGPWSATWTGITPGPPTRPRILALNSRDGTLSFAWTHPMDRGRAITSYDVQYRLADSPSWEEIVSAVTDIREEYTQREYRITNLTNGRMYEVRVRAVNVHGPGAWSAISWGWPWPSRGGGGGGGGGSSGGSSSSGGGSRAPSPPPPPPRSPIIGSTSAATAKELAGDLLVLQRHDQPGVEIEVPVGWISRDGQQIIAIGFVRDGDLGQTYAVVRREGDGQVVRRWIAPDSALVYAVPWAVVNTQYTFPVGVIEALPLDDQYPWPNQLARRFDGGDDRILAYDAELGQWRHVPDEGTFQALGFYWCNVTAADAGFFDRITLGPPYPASNVPARADYPVCQT